MKRSPMVRRYVDTGPDDATVALVLERDGHACVRCGRPAQGQRGWDWSLQHRKKRSAGVDNRACNLVTACGNGSMGCHGFMEDNPAEAMANGWGVSRYANPEDCPVLVDHGSRWVYLTGTGEYADNPPSFIQCACVVSRSMPYCDGTCDE